MKNYRADGLPFWNEIKLSPIVSEGENVRYLIGFNREVSSPHITPVTDGLRDSMMREVQHRVKNHISMIIKLIRTQLLGPTDTTFEEFRKLARRIDALQLLYEQVDIKRQRYENVDLGAYVSKVVAAVTHINFSKGVRVNLNADAVEVPVDLAVQIGLVLSEILTNSIEHAFDQGDGGVVDIALRAATSDPVGEIITLSIEDDGRGFPEGSSWPDTGSSGGRIVKELLGFANAALDVTSGSGGAAITIEFPL